MEKRGRGRPKGSVKMTIQRFADNPPLVLPKTDHQRLKELKELMIRSGGKDVAQKVIEIALNDDHPHQLVALKMCLDRTLPVSLFEKDKSQRSAVTINITGLGQEPLVVDTETPLKDKSVVDKIAVLVPSYNLKFLSSEFKFIVVFVPSKNVT